MPRMEAASSNDMGWSIIPHLLLCGIDGVGLGLASGILPDGTQAIGPLFVTGAWWRLANG
uniref:DNA gyrase subunit A n=1 Tax=Aureimonas altamirensis TaxID=370622 RepID=A0A0P0YX64_9HYPH|nr:DNA gyrase subunit A [Aureimonas altamirensis]